MRGLSDDEAKAEVAALIRSFFEVGKSKDIASLMGYHSPASIFTKFDENPPYTRQNSEEAFMMEQAEFANIADYDYKIEALRIDLIGDAAIATFYLTFTGVFVNDYSFEGMTVGAKSRVTMVVARFDGGLRIVHEHFSRFADISRKEGRGQ